jgi:hypothetical protein
MAAQRPQNLGQVIDHEAISAGKHLAPDDVHFPAWDVAMDPIEECGVVEFFGQWIEQVRMLEHVGHRMLGIADKHHGCLGAQRLHPARERFVGHVVLHDVDQRLVDALLLASEFIKGHHIPVAHQAQLAGELLTNNLGTVTSPPEIRMPCGENSE